MLVVTRHAAVTAILEDPSYVVPPVPDGARPGTIAWLRAKVCRFSSGEAHRRRRALATGELARIEPETLRHRGLAEALGLDAGAAGRVAAVARAYHPGTGDGAEADRAVAALVTAFGGTADEATAARICLLVQAHAATAGLVAAARPRRGQGPPAAIIAETLRHDPPVRATRRMAPDGVPVLLDLAQANRDPDVFADPDRFDPERPAATRHLTFGAGPHACPGRDHALALASQALR
jgi:cytochrome P450